MHDNARVSSPIASGNTNRWLLIGIPLDGSRTQRGEPSAPTAVRRAGLGSAVTLVDFGDLDVAVTNPARDGRTGIVAFQEIVASSRVIRDCVASALAAKWRPLIIGGCSSILPGVLAGVRRHLGPFGLVSVDGHLGLHDAATSPTGELGTMGLAIAIGHGPA